MKLSNIRQTCLAATYRLNSQVHKEVSGYDGASAMNNRVQYQQFDITIRTNLDGTPTRFDVVWQIQNTENGRNLVNSRFTCKEFDSEKAAYEFGLREARAWIDEHALLRTGYHDEESSRRRAPIGR